MSDIIETYGKTVEEALNIAVKELGVTKDQVNYEIIEETEKKGLFGIFGGSKQVKIKVSIIKEDFEDSNDIEEFKQELFQETLNHDNVIEVAKDFLKNIFKKMDIDVLIEKFQTDERTITLNLHGENLGILIGKHGQTLDSLQYLTNLVANKGHEDFVRIILDIENYRKRRAETLVKLALRLADKAKHKNERIVLEPMNPQERKIIHMALQDDRRITTFSEGEEPFRRIIIMQKRG